MRFLAFCLSLTLTASAIAAQEAPLGLAAPDGFTKSGFLKYVLPRFSLKTGIRVIPDPDGAMVLAETAPGTPVFQGGGTIYYLRIADDPRQRRFLDWLTSDIGKRTVAGFKIDGTAPFDTDFKVAQVVEGPRFTGNLARGEAVSNAQCARCHVIGDHNRMSGIGSTPSFPVLRALPDWSERFETFFLRRPHIAFTLVADVTAPFDPERPPPIVPLQITLEDLDAILAFVAVMTPADLGAPLQFQ